MADFINMTGSAGIVFDGLVAQAGSHYFALLSLFIVLLLILLLFRVPLEFAVLILLPLSIVMWAYDTRWLAIAGLMLIFAGIIFARNLPNQ